MTENPNALELRGDELARFIELNKRPVGSREFTDLATSEIGIEVRAARDRHMYCDGVGRHWKQGPQNREPF